MCPVTVAYHIMAHQKPSQLRLLVDLLCRSGDDDNDHIVLIHVDRTAPAPVHHAAELARRDHRCVHVQAPREVRWGGYSGVAVTLAGIEELLGLGRWSHFINLSGTDLPLIGTSQVAAELVSRPQESWIETHAPDRWQHPRRRIDPVWRETSRSREVHRSRLELRRDWLLGRRTWRGQSAWMVLARPHCELIVDPWRTWNLRAFFRWSLLPDESFFATAFTGWDATVHDENKRFIRWTQGRAHPDLLGPEDLEAAAESGAWFARKFDLDRDKEREMRDLLAPLLSRPGR